MGILITGGTGSFGRAVVKHLLTEDYDLGDQRIIVYSRGEHTQADMMRECAPLDRFNRLRFFIGDVRDRDRLRRAFFGVRYVLHAAALKRIEVGYYNPTEMVRTNVEGAINVIEAANDMDVEKVVMLSTDKAWQPISAYGFTKATAECLFLNAYQGRTICAVTRYGNVWNSAGSVVPTWKDQVAKGQVVRITDPEATRFYMTMQQAIDLVLNTIKTMKGGELVIPTLPAYRLGDLLMTLLPEPIKPGSFVVTGLPPYEKLHEGMGPGKTSDVAERMTQEQIRAAL